MQTCHLACMKPEAIDAHCILEQTEAELSTLHASASISWILVPQFCRGQVYAEQAAVSGSHGHVSPTQ